MMISINHVLVTLQVFFMFTSATVERAYCSGPLSLDDKTPMVVPTIQFCQQYNPLFEARPRWLIQATCIHAYYFWILYLTILITAATNSWGTNHPKLQFGILLGIGAKLYAVMFYHYMEFTSDMPPPNPLAYFGAEGAYIVSIGLVLYKIISTTTTATNNNATVTEPSVPVSTSTTTPTTTKKQN